jgi:predicted small metal-binding protein
MLIEVTCMCGFQARGTEDDVVAQMQAHGLADHGQASSRETILRMAIPIGEGPEDGRLG